MFLLAACVSIISVLCVVLFVSKRNRGFDSSNIPSPKKSLFLHNAFEVLGLDLNGLFKKFESWFNELGDVYHVTFHPFDCGTVFVADYKVAEVLSLHQPDRTRSLMYKPLSRWIGENGLFLTGGSHQKMRMKMIANAFSPKYHDKYTALACGHFEECVNIIKKSGQKQMDFFPWCRNAILDIMFGEIFHLNFKVNVF
jgi:cytochrome P450